MHCSNINTLPLGENNEVAGYIYKGGEMLKSGLMWMGGIVA